MRRFVRRLGSRAPLLALLIVLAMASPARAWEFDISGSNVVFTVASSGYPSSVWLYNLDTRQYTRISTSEELEVSPAIVGNHVYFIRGGIFFELDSYDLTSGQLTSDITNSDWYAPCGEMHLSGDAGHLTFVAAQLPPASTNAAAVYLLDPSATLQPLQVSPQEPEETLTPTTGNCIYGQDIDYPWVTWFDSGGAGSGAGTNLYAKNLETGIIKTLSTVYVGTSAEVANGLVATDEEEPQGQTLVVYTLNSGARTPISTPTQPSSIGVTDFRGSRIVYRGEGDVWIYDLSTGQSTKVTDLTDNQDPELHNPIGRISGDWIIYGSETWGGKLIARNLQTGEKRVIWPQPNVEPIKHYVALGDSVASGEGINYGFAWVPGGAGSGHWKHTGPDNPTWEGGFQDCHQSAQAYPDDLATNLGLDLTKLACTGASSEFGLLNPGNNNVPPEPELGNGSSANAVYDASKPDIVTLSVGADDLHFGDAVKNCYESLSDCHPDPTNDLVAQKANLIRVLTEIKQRGEAAGKVPLVLLTTYYDPFPAQYPAQPSDCVDLAPFHILFTSKGLLSNYEMDVLRNDLLFLNHNIRSAAADFPNVLVVNPPPAFQQHTWCSSDPWVYGPSIDAPSLAHPTGWNNPAPFHPTPEGQAAIANELESAISNAQVVPTGEDINVPVGSGASVTFDQVTSSGSVVLAPEGSGPTLPPSDNHVRQSAFDIATSAGYQGNIRISVPSSQPAELYHYTNGAWQQVADSTFDGHNVTGSVTSLSPFALGTPAPQVHASFTETGAGEAPASVSFDASGSSVDSGGTIAGYQWDFGDGTADTGKTPTHQYTRSGSYHVVLRATSDQGAVATASGIVVITNSPPTAAISAPAQAAPSQVISFSGAESSDPNGSISDWVWDFGDGSGTQTGTEVQHSYETPGTYTVTLIALDDEGAAGSATTQVQVLAPLATPPSDAVPPETRITSGPAHRSKKRKLRFRFTANEAGSAFRCKLDHHAFAPCVSPRTYRVKPGVHLFQVYAIDAAGNRDTTPARWKIKVTK